MSKNDRCQRHEAFFKLHAEISKLGELEKADYLHALRVAPHLVLSESEPLRFLRWSNYNAGVAARGIVKYWTRRRAVFGDERAFRPLILTGEGALSKRDVEFISHGMWAELPNDSEGCTVVLVDTARRLFHDIETRLHAIFYYGQVISENEKSQSKGAVIMVIITDPKFDSATQESMKLMTNTFPFTTKAGHYINCIPSWHNSWLLRGFTRGIIGLFGQFFRHYQTYFYPPSTKEELLDSLEKHGLTKEGLPDRVGGTWSYQRFAEWLTQRTEREKAAYPTAVVNAKPDASTSPAKSPLGGETSNETTIATPTVVEPSVPATYEIYEISRDQLDVSMNQLPQQETAAYRKALQTTTHQVWKNESNPHWFLRMEFLLPWLAAKRLARYWQFRTDCFSYSTAFEPLTQTGEDALGRLDNIVMQSGFATPLPPDVKGRPVLFVDGSQLRPDFRAENVCRCLFYMLSLLAENENSRTVGAVLLLKGERTFFEWIGAATFFERASLAFPIHFQAVYVVAETALPATILSHIKFPDKSYFLFNTTGESVANELEEQQGLARPGIPTCFNGEWSYAKFLQWRELRTRIEWQIPLGLSGRDNTTNTFPALKSYNLLPEEAKTEKNRRMNVIHSRRKQDRKRLALFVEDEKEETSK